MQKPKFNRMLRVTEGRFSVTHPDQLDAHVQFAWREDAPEQVRKCRSVTVKPELAPARVNDLDSAVALIGAVEYLIEATGRPHYLYHGKRANLQAALTYLEECQERDERDRAEYAVAHWREQRDKAEVKLAEAEERLDILCDEVLS